VPDDVPDESWTDEEPESETPPVAHDDIMKRLMNYQRSLREGASPAEAAEVAQHPSAEPAREAQTATGELLDLSVTEPEVEVEFDVTTEAEPETEAAPRAEAETGELVEPEVAAEAEPEAEIGSAAEPEDLWSAELEPEPYAAVPEESGPQPIAAEESPALYETAAAEPAGVAEESRDELVARVVRLEERLERLGSKLGELRQSFQDMAIAADERLAAMEDEAARTRTEQAEE
jgi:pilus assembly protein FimV